MDTPASASAGLAACEDEPIHAPGAIQPHGVLLALEPDALTVRHASDNWRELFAIEPAVFTGCRVGELLGPAAVLLDVQMPDLGGPQTLAALREIDPGVRCVFMSGNTGRYTAEQLLGLGAARVLPKPFSSLGEVVRVPREAVGP